ncbi:MAG: hypothetical protein AB7V40_04785 [Methyloceanibacter sp.]
MEYSATMDVPGPNRAHYIRTFGNFICCALALSLLMMTVRFARAETPADIVAIGIPGGSSTVYAWYRTGFVSQGTSDNLGNRRAKYPFTVPAPLTPANIVGISGFREPYWRNGARCDWLTVYDDLTLSIGTSDNLARCYSGLSYQLPPGRNPRTILDIAIKKTGRAAYDEGPIIYVFYSGGEVSIGSFSFSSSLNRLYERRCEHDVADCYHDFTLPEGFRAPAIVGVDMAPGDNHVFTWLNSGDVMSGTRANLYRYRSPYRFIVP